MALQPLALSDREKAVLRLLAQGHDAKSTACKLGISVHAVNERLRSARRKLGVSSSREAARLLASSELAVPNSLVDKKIGVGLSNAAGETRESKGGKHAFALAVGGIFAVSLAIVIAILATAPSQTAASGPLPNWSLQPALPDRLPPQSNRVHLDGNRLLWNGDEASEPNIRAFLTVVETQMSPQPLTILSYGSQVSPARIQRTRRLIDGVLHCKPATCLEVTAPLDDAGTSGAAPKASSRR